MKRKTLLFMMLMVMFSPLALNAQGTFGTFATGEDESRWITLDDPQTAMSSGLNEVASDLLTMGSGFSFPFGNGLYTQFWVNSNGMFSFSTNPAENERLWSNSCFPKICGISADLSTGEDGYIKYQLTGTAPNRVFVCEFVMDPLQIQSASDVRWQIQLHEAGSKVVIIYGATPSANPRFYQSGLSLSANDFWLLDPQTHAATHYTSIPEDRLSGWHGRCRYYEFTPPACYNSPTGLDVVENSLTTRGVTMQWDAEVDDVFDYAIELGTNITPQNVTYAGSITATATTCSKTWDNLVPNSDYTVFIRRSCGDYGQPATMVIHTEAACASPTNLTATANRKTAILTWEGSADSYEIAWSLDPNANPDENIDPDFQISGTSGSKEFTTIDTQYYFWVRAYDSGDGYSLWEPIDTYIGYCRPNPWSVDGSNIYQFAFFGTKDMYNHDRPTAFPYYGYYIDKICEMNETATVSINYQTGYAYKTYIWVDLDNSLTFEDSEILYVGTSAEGASVFLDASITLPGGTPPGDYRMRIGGARAGYISGMDYAGDPCYNQRWAIFEDYTLRVHAVSCPRPYALTTTNLTLNSATLNWESDAESFDVQYRTTHVETDFSEGFENGLPSNWSTIHNGSNPNDSWIPNDNSSYAHSGTGCMYSFSNDPDEWLISPQVPLHGTLKFYLRAVNEEHFAVYVSTGTTSIDDFVMVGEERVVDPSQTYNEITVDLNSFNGTMGYVAIRHFNSAFMSANALILDDFSIYYYQEYGPWIETTSETNSLDLTNLIRNTGYEFKVKGHCGGNETSIWSDIATFTTPDYCSAPYDLTAEAVSNTVELGWTGYSDTYNVRYRHFTNDPYNELATVILTAGPPFYEDAGGFQMLLDANANAIGPGQFDLFTKPYEDWFEYTIPVDADKYYYTSHMVSNGSVAIQIPAGTYDWVIVNPNPRYEHVDYIGDQGNVGHQQDNYVFEAGKVYEFEVKMYGRLSGADVTITEQTSDWTLVEEVPNPCTLTDLIAGTRYQFQVQGVNCDGNGSNTEWSEIGTFTTVYLGYELPILGYEEEFVDPDGGYYLIASPVTVNPANAIDLNTQQSMIEGEFDLYYFDQSQDLEWINYKGTDGNFNLEPGKGYLYAHDTSREFIFTGTPYSGSGVINLKYDSNAPNFAGWNLLGNPYNYQVSVDKAFYVMNQEGTEIISADETMPIEPMQGFFVVATEAEQTVTFSEWHAPYVPLDKLVMNLTNKRGATIDRAIVRFDGGHQLPKFQLNKRHTKVYIPQEDKDYAIVNAENQGELPVNFKAEKNGTYTLSVSESLNSKLTTLNASHFLILNLIDNLTGIETDLLANPSYSFEAKTTDYESRFKLVFRVDEDNQNSNDNFAFFHNGELIVNGEGMLQIFDVLGHEILCRHLSPFTSHLSPFTSHGVYVLRLIDGQNVRTQKIVID
ncbi:MAG: DUF2436 domain-containing protein [Bacteroidales bacterium]|nr:DUF2436 domain-containing protein [Bacteroidales bacterium]